MLSSNTIWSDKFVVLKYIDWKTLFLKKQRVKNLFSAVVEVKKTSKCFCSSIELSV